MDAKEFLASLEQADGVGIHSLPKVKLVPDIESGFDYEYDEPRPTTTPIIYLYVEDKLWIRSTDFQLSSSQNRIDVTTHEDAGIMRTMAGPPDHRISFNVALNAIDPLGNFRDTNSEDIFSEAMSSGTQIGFQIATAEHNAYGTGFLTELRYGGLDVECELILTGPINVEMEQVGVDPNQARRDYVNKLLGNP